MVCTLFTNLETIADLLVWPTGCFYHFYTVILFTLFTVLSLSLYFIEKERAVKSDIISSLGVSSIATFFLAVMGTLIKDSSGIPMIQQDILLYVLALTIVFVLIWFFKK